MSERSYICVLELYMSERSYICVLELYMSERSYICVLELYILPLSTIFFIGFWNCSDHVIYLYFIVSLTVLDKLDLYFRRIIMILYLLKVSVMYCFVLRVMVSNRQILPS
jgi:hypothetical protein